MTTNTECTTCGVTAADLPWEDLAMANLEEASDLLFDWIDGKPYCQGCVNGDGAWSP